MSRLHPRALLFVPTLALLVSCSLIGVDCPETESAIEERIIDVEPFTAITVNGPIDVMIGHAGEQVVKVIAPPEYIALLDTHASRGSWSIGTDECDPSERIRVHIQLPGIEGITVNGSGTVTGRSTWTGEQLKVSSNGSGQVELDTDVTRLDVEMNGSGSMVLRGTARVFHLQMNGSGMLRGEDLSAAETKVRINGSGDARVTAVDVLDATIIGSGNVYYIGRPRIISSVKGSGAVVPMERDRQD